MHYLPLEKKCLEMIQHTSSCLSLSCKMRKDFTVKCSTIPFILFLYCTNYTLFLFSYGLKILMIAGLSTNIECT